jgi:hypothetical protein
MVSALNWLQATSRVFSLTAQDSLSSSAEICTKAMAEEMSEILIFFDFIKLNFLRSLISLTNFNDRTVYLR